MSEPVPPQRRWRVSGPTAAAAGTPPVGDQTGGADRIARTLDRVVSRRLQRDAERAADAGDAAGRRVGAADPAARMDPETIRGRAFNRAAREVGARQLETQLRARLDELAIQHEADPGALAAKAKSYIDGVRKTLPPDLVGRFESATSTILRPYVSQARREQEAALGAQRIAAFNHAQRERLQAITRNARMAPRDAAAAAALEQDLATVREDLVVLGPRHAFTFRGVEYPADPTRAGAVDVADMEAQLADVEREAAEQTAMGAYEAGPRTAEWVNGFERQARREGVPGLDQDQIDGVLRRMRADANRRRVERERAEARAERARAAELDALADRVQAADQMILEGYMPEGVEELIDDSRGTELEAEVDRLLEIGRDVQAFRTQPAAAQAERLEEMERRATAGELSPAEFDRLGRLAGVYQRQQRAADQDGLTAYTRTMGGELPPLDLAAPESLARRVAVAREASAHYGREVSPLTAGEAATLANRFAEAETAQERAALLAPLLDAPARFRSAAIRQFERARGDAGGLPPGTVPLLLDQLRDPARRPATLSTLTRLTTEAPKLPQGEAPRVRRAVDDVMTDGVPGVRAAAMATSGDMAPMAQQTRDRQLLEHLTTQAVAAGRDPDQAAREAHAALFGHLEVIDEPDLAHLYLPRARVAAEGATIKLGLEVLRERAAERVRAAAPPGELAAARGDVRAVAEDRRRARADALATGGVWINADGGLALVAPGTGEAVELRDQVVRVTLDEVLAAGRQAAREGRAATAAVPPVRGPNPPLDYGR